MMASPVILEIGVVVLLVLIFLSIFNRWNSRNQVKANAVKGVRRRVKFGLVTGTDADLKLELGFLAYLLSIVFLAPPEMNLWELGPPSWLLLCLGLLVGYYLRQWLSKWRLRNLVFFPIILKSRLVYFKSASDTLIITATVLLGAYLASAGIALAGIQFVGFLAHEIILEAKKGHKLLRRKLHLFDLEGSPVPADKYAALLLAISKYDFKTLDRIISTSVSPKEELLLRAFRALLRDDFAGFHGLIEKHEETIFKDRDLLFYFGKTLYIIGDVEKAKEFLRCGAEDHQYDLCISYYALCLMATVTDKKEVAQILQLLDIHTKKAQENKSAMFIYGFHALALAISASKDPSEYDERLGHAVVLIHRSFKINDMYLKRGDLGPLGYTYFSANDNMFLDIYGYVLYKMNNTSLAFRAFHTAISEDETYPWPYFHLALIYEEIGRLELAEALLLRIARNERSNSVLRRLCLVRLKRYPVNISP